MASIFGAVKLEQPKYTVEMELQKDVEIRVYPASLRAEHHCDTPGAVGTLDGLDGAFKVLADYTMWGKNSRRDNPKKNEKISLTAPVMTTVVSSDPPKKSMSMFMPSSKYSKLEELPIPNDNRVQLLVYPPMKYAALRFKGAMNNESADKNAAELRTICEKAGVKIKAEASAVHYCTYNPPWALPAFRFNDILIPLEEQPAQ